MDAIISDISGQTVAKKFAYKVDIFNRDSGTHLEVDGTFEEFKSTPFDSVIANALQNGKKWYKISKNDQGKWERVEQN